MERSGILSSPDCTLFEMFTNNTVIQILPFKRVYVEQDAIKKALSRIL